MQVQESKLETIFQFIEAVRNGDYHNEFTSWEDEIEYFRNMLDEALVEIRLSKLNS